MDTPFHHADNDSVFQKAKVSGAFRAENPDSRCLTPTKVLEEAEAKWLRDVKESVFINPTEEMHKEFVLGYIYGFKGLLEIIPKSNILCEVILKLEVPSDVEQEFFDQIMQKYGEIAEWYKTNAPKSAQTPTVLQQITDYNGEIIQQTAMKFERKKPSLTDVNN